MFAAVRADAADEGEPVDSHRHHAVLGLDRRLAARELEQAAAPKPMWRSRGMIGSLVAGLAGIAGLLLWVTFAGQNFEWLSWQTFVMVGGALAALVAASSTH